MAIQATTVLIFTVQTNLIRQDLNISYDASSGSGKTSIGTQPVIKKFEQDVPLILDGRSFQN